MGYLRGYKKNFSRTEVGFPIGTASAKRVLQTFSHTPMNNGDWFWKDVTFIGQTTTNNIDGRQRQMVNFRGIKLMMELKNTQNDRDVIFNYAVVMRKNAAAAEPTQADWFRNWGDSTTNRFKAFSKDNSTIQNNYGNINTDRYLVLLHKRVKLGPENANGNIVVTDFSRAASKKYIKRYVKINRQIRYDDASQRAETPLFLVIWCDNTNQAAGTRTQATACDVLIEVVQYFKEPKN